MPEEKQKIGKMKVAGYSCILFAAVVSVLVLFTGKVKPEEALPIVYYWGGLGVTLLFGNAGKRIGGAVVQNKAEQTAGFVEK